MDWNFGRARDLTPRALTTTVAGVGGLYSEPETTAVQGAPAPPP
eukprot:SAG11_NODE_2747_length_3012_cov_1.881909_3_plen_44_part_00